MLLKLILSKSFGLRDSICKALFLHLKPLYFILRYRRPGWKTDLDALRNMPIGTLGQDMYRHLTRNDFDFIPKAESHDAFHVLFDYDSSMLGETCLQFALLGNGKRSLVLLITNAASFFLYPEYWQAYRAAYEEGKKYQRFFHLDLESLLMEPTDQLKKQFRSGE